MQPVTNGMISSAKNLLGMGPGSKFDPIKAAVVVDDDEDGPEEEQKTSSDNNGASRSTTIDSGVITTDHWNYTQQNAIQVKNIIEELDEIIDIDKE